MLRIRVPTAFTKDEYTRFVMPFLDRVKVTRQNKLRDRGCGPARIKRKHDFVQHDAIIAPPIQHECWLYSHCALLEMQRDNSTQDLVSVS